MRVAWGKISLTSTEPRLPAYGLRIGGVPAAQPAARLRAVAREVFARGNAGNEISFTVQREHRTAGDCQVYLVQHKRAMDQAGRADLALQFAGGVKLTLASAVLTQCTGEERGVRSVFTYTFAGGLLT